MFDVSLRRMMLAFCRCTYSIKPSCQNSDHIAAK